MFSRKTVVLAAALGAAAVGISAGSSAAAPTAGATPTSPAGPVGLPSVIPAWAASAAVTGSTPGDQTVPLLLALRGKDPVGEHALGLAVSTPGNPLYRHYLSLAEFEQRFAPAAGVATATVAALKTLGVSNPTVDPMGLTVSAKIPASLAATIFGVSFHEVRHGGQSVRVPLNEPVLPAALAAAGVVAVDGLTEHPLHTDHVMVGRASLASIPEPPAVSVNTCATALPAGGAPQAYFNPQDNSSLAVYGSKLATDKPTYRQLAGDTSTTKPYNVAGYTPAQIRGAYGVNNVAQDGTGVKVGIALFFDGPDVGCDLATFSAQQHLAAPTYIDITPENQSQGVALSPTALAGAAGEQTLDAEAIHQMAPGASIYYSGAEAPLDENIYTALERLFVAGVEVINNSYGGVGDTDASNAQIFATAVTDPAMTLGVGLNYSSGDAGDEIVAQGVRESDFPSTSDAVTSVGGTGIEIGANGTYNGEFYWGTYSTPALATNALSWGTLASQVGGAAGGGGVSTNYAEPDYQKGVVPDLETHDLDNGTAVNATSGTGITTPGRVTPDIAMIGDSTTGLLVGETQQPDVTSTGGVPNTTPAFSYFRIGGTSVSSPIFTGLVALADQALGKSAGFINPALYASYKLGNGAFRDPQIGRTAMGSRQASSASQVLTGCTGSVANSDLSCVGSGPGVVPVVAEVRADYTDTANPGIATATTFNPSGLAPVATAATPGNKEIFHLRGQGILGTLEDLPGYDDSTGLGSPLAAPFIADIVGTTPSQSLPEAPTPLLLLVAGAALGAAVVVRRRRRVAA